MGQKYKNQQKSNIKRIAFLIIIFFALILLILMTSLVSIKEKNKQENLKIQTGKFDSVKSILEYYGCKFKGQKSSKEEGFTTDIETIFKYDLYDNEKNNEKFYNNVINDVAKFLNYTNFRIIDNEKEESIVIEVYGNGLKIEKIIINGIEDYFIYMDSQISLSKYKKINTTEISVQSPELIKCIQNEWSKDTDFGTRESIFQKYYIYFEEGIKTRKINGKIYNVIFTKNYVKPVINGFTVGENHDIIIREFGTPTFKNEDESIIGYKSKDIYVFFEKDQISIYRNTSEQGFNEFFTLVDEFLDEKYSLLEFMNELTYIWPDYDEYTYDSETVFLSYPNKGIDIKLNYENVDGIVLYNNIGVNQDIVNKYLKHTEFVAQLQVDNIFNAEKRRVERENSWYSKCKEYQEEFENNKEKNRSGLYNYYMKMSENNKIISVYFISKDKQFPDCELNENVDNYIWMNDYCFIYSKAKNGIYYYDLKTQSKGNILTGKENYEIKSFENGVLKYDDKQINIQY